MVGRKVSADENGPTTLAEVIAAPAVTTNSDKRDQGAPVINPAKAPTRAKATPQFPTVPSDYFWRVRSFEDKNFGTCYIVSLRKRGRIFSKEIARVACPANEYTPNYQGTNLADPGTLARLGKALWEAGEDRSAAVNREAGYKVRAREMRRYSRDFDHNRTLDEVK